MVVQTNLETAHQIRPRTLPTISFLIIHLLLTAQQSLVGHGLLIVEASRSHSDAPNSVGLLWTSDQPIAETST